MVRNNNRAKYLAAAMLAAVLAMPMFSEDASAVTGTTNVSVSVPGSIILSYQSALTITFTNGFAVAQNEGAGAMTIANMAASVSGSAGMTTNAVASAPTTMAVTVTTAWSTRSHSSTTVSISCGATCTGTNATAGGGTVAVSGLTVSTSAPAAGPAASITYAGAGLGTSNAVVGQIDFNLDLSSMTKAGTFTGIAWTITATAV